MEEREAAEMVEDRVVEVTLEVNTAVRPAAEGRAGAATVSEMAAWRVLDPIAHFHQTSVS